MKIHEATEQAYKNGYDKGYEDGRPKWIPVTDMFPKDGDRVLAYYQDGMVRVIVNDGGFPMVLSNKLEWVMVTHWMPLPTPPKGE